MSPRAKEFTERINIFLTPEQLEKVKEKASEMGLNVSSYVRLLVIREINSKTSA